jgi:catechol 2,3-dioxygenase-like lactoylglutathione lyase family enzyme
MPEAVAGGLFSGAHTVIFSRDAEADRAFLRDVLGFAHVDAGGGWLIFALPPGEAAIHPDDTRTSQELYLICEDVAAAVAALEANGVQAAPVTDEGWGLLSAFTLPGGSRIGFYQPRHPGPF